MKAVDWDVQNPGGIATRENLLANASAKAYQRGAHRCCSPEETLRRVTPYLECCGITRVANITGLDRIGIPVFISVRPNARSVCLTYGKGIDPTAARVSAIMEAVETHHAEFHTCPIRVEPYAELRHQVAVAEPQALPLRRESLFHERLPIPWVEGFDLLQREPAWVPFELVHCDFTVPAMPGSGCFQAGSNGLASGNALAEAILHGLCEVVERDARALWRYASAEQRKRRRLDLTSVSDEFCVELLERYAAAGISVMAWDLTSDLGVPVIVTIIFEASDGLAWRPIPPAYGCGCHPDRAIAMSRALTEAAQNRLGAVAGSRDNSTGGRAQGPPPVETLPFYRRLAASGPHGVDFRSAPSTASGTIEGDLLHVLGRLRSVGLERAIVVDLSRPELPVSVVRVVVPGLEGFSESGSYRPGRRVEAQ